MTIEQRSNGMMVGPNGLTVQGAMLKVGDPAPDFQLTSNRFENKTLDNYAGKIKIISVVPSLPTSTCSAQTQRFNQEAADLGDDIVILTVSADLPLAQRQWCSAEGVKQVETLSTHRDMQFADAYGVHVIDWRVTQRAVFVLDKDNIVIHAEYMPAIGDEVDFDAAIEAAKSALN